VGPIAATIGRLSGRVARTEPPKLFLAIGRRPALLVSWLVFASRLMPRGKLPRRDGELVILRVAHLTGCNYERTHHERLGRRAGLSREEIDRIGAGSSAAGWSERDQVLLAAVEELDSARDLVDSSYADLASQLSEVEIVELLMLVGHYQMLAQVITTLRIPPDEVRR
jgi:AhpD family alkylhydroperoxidase